MIYTNKFNLPGPVVRAITSDRYNRGESDFTVTELANPPRPRMLLRLFSEATVDIRQRWRSFMGTAFHLGMERATRPGVDISEVRYYIPVTVDDILYSVGAQIDLFETDTGTLWDFKSSRSGAFSKKRSVKPDWVAQLNVQALGLRLDGKSATKLKILGHPYNWEAYLAEDDPDYPQQPFIEREVKMWPEVKVYEWLSKRIRVHVAAEKTLPLCSSADAYGGDRCRDWCDASGVCDQYKNSIKTGLFKGADNAVQEA